MKGLSATFCHSHKSFNIFFSFSPLLLKKMGEDFGGSKCTLTRGFSEKNGSSKKGQKEILANFCQCHMCAFSAKSPRHTPFKILLENFFSTAKFVNYFFCSREKIAATFFSALWKKSPQNWALTSSLKDPSGREGKIFGTLVKYESVTIVTSCVI